MQGEDALKKISFDTRHPRFGVVEIRQRKDGQSIRIAFGRRMQPNGRYYSRKTGGSHWWESRVELQGLYHAEVDPNILAYVTQPETLYWEVDGSVRRYTPDRLDELADGSFRAVEVKDVFSEADDPDYAAKLAEATEIYASMGVALEIRTRADITSEPRYSAVEEVQFYRRSLVTTHQVLVAAEVLGTGSLPLADFLQCLPAPHPRPSAFAMMVARHVCIDLTHGLSESSLVSLVGGR